MLYVSADACAVICMKLEPELENQHAYVKRTDSRIMLDDVWAVAHTRFCSPRGPSKSNGVILAGILAARARG